MRSQTRRLGAAVIAAMMVTALVVMPMPAGADPTPGQCLDPGEIDYEFTFDHTRIVSGESPSNAYVVPLSTPIPSGIEYSVFKHVYDGYDGRIADGNADERLVVDFLDAGGTVIRSTAANVDLNNVFDEASDFGLRGVLFFPREAVSVRVRHVADDSGADPASGLGLVCVSLRIKTIFPSLTTTTTTTTPSTTTSSTTTSTTSTTTSTTTTSTTTSTTSTTTSTTTTPVTSSTTTSTTTTTPVTSSTTSSTTTTVPESTTTTVPESTTTTVPESTTTTVPESTTTTVPDSTTTTVPDSTTTSTVPQVSPPEVEPSDPADPVDGVPTFTG